MFGDCSDRGAAEPSSGRSVSDGGQRLSLNAVLRTVTSVTKSTHDEKFLPDSGYATATSSLSEVSKGNPADDDSQRSGPPSSPNARAIPFPHPGAKGLFVFKREVGTATVARFNEIVPEVERLLLAHLKSGRGLFSTPPRFTPMAIRLMVLGRSPADACPAMAVFCPAAVHSRVEHFMEKEQLVRDLCRPSDPAVPSFRVVVTNNAPRLRLALSDTEVYSTRTWSLDNTCCGTPLLFDSGMGRLRSRQATFGGIVKVTDKDGVTGLYGMTAGHVLLGLEDTDASVEVEDSISQEEPWCFSLEERGNAHLEDDDWPLDDEDSQERALKSWVLAGRKVLGHVVERPCQVAASSDESQQYFDWALFTINQCRPNTLPGFGRNQPLMLHRNRLPTCRPQPVIMLGGPRGQMSGAVSKLPGRIMIGPGNSFIDAYILRLDYETVSDGASGSWVVDPCTFEVYGHVVATDMFGDAYVVPLVDTLADIKGRLGARDVDLPDLVDFSITTLTSQIEHTEELAQGGVAIPAARPRSPDSGYMSMRTTPRSLKPVRESEGSLW